MDSILEKVRNFLKEHYIPKKPLLLAFSGGPDSLCLFLILKQLKEEFELDLHVAHMDHAWRQESSIQAEKMKFDVENQGFIFHVKQGSGLAVSNAEDIARDERFSFFKELYDQYHYQAVLLAHHGDDVKETVLKRILEGASPLSCSGPAKLSKMRGMRLLRPLLDLSKKEITAYLERAKADPLIDTTNFDKRFLRARMREEILPSLEKSFGKRVGANLIAWKEFSTELEAYFLKRTASMHSLIKRGPFGCYVNLSSKLPMEKLELYAFLKTVFKNENIILSKKTFDLILEILQEKKANKRILSGKKELIIDRGKLFILEKKPPHFLENLQLKSQTLFLNEFEVKVDCFKTNDEVKSYSWQDLWEGKVQVVLPEAEYLLKPALKKERYQGKGELKNWWEDHKTPAFLREWLPCVYLGDQLIHEFITGKNLNNNLIKKTNITIIIEIKIR